MIAKSFVLAPILLAIANAVEFQIVNKGSDILVGIQGNPNHPHLRNGGFALKAGQKASVQAPTDWAGRFWARTGCDANSHCVTGDCGNKLECAGAGGNPPASLAEITLKGNAGLDYYDISLVDGFNVAISIEPVGAKGDGSHYSCAKSACGASINSQCPGELQVKNAQGTVIACNSACNALHTDEYCCTGAHDKPETCKSSDWPKDYAKFFKDRCPDAYSYAYDDRKSTFTCKSEKYVITFG